MMDKFKISVVVPVHNEEDNIPVLVKALTKVLVKYGEYEILFVNDGSKDDTLEVLKEQNQLDPHVKYLSFSRNFGHQNALRAGLDHAAGDCIISMDGDMQHPPSLIPKMIRKWQAGADIVYTIRAGQEDIPFFKKLMSKAFYKVMNMLSTTKIIPGTADFRLIDKKVLEVLKTYGEVHMFYRGIIPTLGFDQVGIEYTPQKRLYGKPSYNFKKNVAMALEGITGFSTKPLHLATVMGAFLSILSFMYGIFAIAIRLVRPEVVIEGWTSLLVGVFFLGGIQLLMIGILGEYIGKLFFEIKKRPTYIIKESSL